MIKRDSVEKIDQFIQGLISNNSIYIDNQDKLAMLVMDDYLSRIIVRSKEMRKNEIKYLSISYVNDTLITTGPGNIPPKGRGKVYYLGLEKLRKWDQSIPGF